jgi:hypothetical protein
MLSRLGNNHPNRKKSTQNVPTLSSKSKFKKSNRFTERQDKQKSREIVLSSSRLCREEKHETS